MHCKCKIGTDKCSHIVALLYTLSSFKKQGLTAVPPVISKTSKPQVWHLPARNLGLQAQSVDTLSVSKVKPPSRKRRKTESKRPQKRVMEGILPTLYCPVQPAIPWAQLATAMRGMLSTLPGNRQFSWLLPGQDAPTAPTNVFGSVPRGSVLAMQQPPVENGDIIVDNTAPDFPDLVGQHHQPADYHCCLSKGEQDIHMSLQFDTQTCRDIEDTTRLQSKTPLWKSARLKRLTASQFHRVVIRTKNHEKLAKDLHNCKNIQTKAMKYGLEKEGDAAKLYSDVTNRNVYTCGFVIPPDAPHIGASPDRKVYDPTEAVSHFGLLEIKCPQADSFKDAECLKRQDDGTYRLKTKHAYYRQVMGQMGVTGLLWCDFLVMAKEDYHLERVYFKAEVWREMKKAIDCFFFQHFLPMLASE